MKLLQEAIKKAVTINILSSNTHVFKESFMTYQLIVLYVQAEQDRTVLTKKVQEIEASLTKKEELRLSATIKLARATELADDAQRFINSLSSDFHVLPSQK